MLHRPRPFQRLVRHGQQRQLWEWAVTNAHVALLSAATVVAAARALQLEFRTRAAEAMADQHSKRAHELETDLRSRLERERGLELQVGAQAARAQEHAKRESELRKSAARALAQLQEAEVRERRLQSITERGQHGERVLETLLEELTVRGHAVSYRLQPEIAPGRRPDAVVILTGGRRMVVDSKAPRPPSALLEGAGCDGARREYISTLKRHISELGSKRYHAADERALARTWLLLPGEGYLQAAYDADGVDSGGLHEHAAERAVALVGPSGLRAALQLYTLLQLEEEALDRLEDSQVQERLRQLQPGWTDRLLPRARAMGKDLKRLVSDFNELGDAVRAFDADLRAGVLDLPKARKASLPAVVDEPAAEHLDPKAAPHIRRGHVAGTPSPPCSATATRQLALRDHDDISTAGNRN